MSVESAFNMQCYEVKNTLLHTEHYIILTIFTIYILSLILRVVSVKPNSFKEN